MLKHALPLAAYCMTLDNSRFLIILVSCIVQQNQSIFFYHMFITQMTPCRIYFLQPGYCLNSYTGHPSHVMSLDFHPKKNDLFCFCDSNNEIRYWSISPFSCTRVSKVCPLAFIKFFYLFAVVTFLGTNLQIVSSLYL